MPATRTARPTTRSRKAATPPPPPPAEIEHTPANCRAREMIVRVADKWSMYVIHVLAEAGTVRFSELRRRVDGVSQRMLTVTLRGLERDGLVRRTMHPEVPPRVEYSLTPLGATLREIVRELIAWSGAHLAEVDAARARYDAARESAAVGGERHVSGHADPPLRLRSDVVVIGAGQAGLSSAYHLEQRGLAPVRGFVVLDHAPGPGGAWQHRWPSLTLSTVNRIHDLPGMRFADALEATSAEVKAAEAVPRYFAAYEREFALPVYRPVHVTVVCDRGDRLVVETDRGEVSTRGIINATGTWERPFIPEIAGRGPLRRPTAAHEGLSHRVGVRRPARDRRRRRHLGDPAARRGLARDDDDVGDAASARVPHRSVRRGGGSRRGEARRGARACRVCRRDPSSR